MGFGVPCSSSPFRELSKVVHTLLPCFITAAPSNVPTHPHGCIGDAGDAYPTVPKRAQNDGQRFKGSEEAFWSTTPALPHWQGFNKTVNAADDIIHTPLITKIEE
mmetsp:Transcript_88180/g.153185  ORF Transcript_88180/g.153185 Transcript_88180/m.153185 type:complete len:105 (-) Transcript_88180:622-936(-)